jgi:hypothetical protein
MNAAATTSLTSCLLGTPSLCALDPGAAWDELDSLVDVDRDGLSRFHTT